MEFNLEKLIIDVFNPQRQDIVIILCDEPHGNLKFNDGWRKRFFMAGEWQNCLEKMSRTIGFQTWPILFYEATGANSAPLSMIGAMDGNKIEITEVLSKATICIALTEYSATGPLTNLAEKFGTLRVASMPGVSKLMEKSALATDYKKVAKKCSILAPKLTKAIGASVVFSTGHQFYFDLRNRIAHEDNGQCQKSGIVINLPSGEAYIVPYEGENKKLGLSKTYGALPIKFNGELIFFSVESNKIVDVSGSSQKAKGLKKYFAKDDARRNIAELGLGCNDKAVVTGNVLEDEKAGFHWAYGLSNHLGGTVSIENFKKAENAVHQDYVYAKDSPIEIKNLILRYPDTSEEIIIQNGDYIIF